MNKRRLMKVIVLMLGLAQTCQLGAAVKAPVAANESTAKSSKKMEQPVLETNFSNVMNFKQYSGFTKGQLDLLRKNGFVVMEQDKEYPYLKMHQVYEGAEYRSTPLFISTDAVLNLYHIFYSDSLKGLENSLLGDKLTKLSNIMLKESISLYKNSDFAEEKDQLKKIAAYYATACLMEGQSVNAVPDEIKKLAAAEKTLIDGAQGNAISPILGKNMDYTQYTVRGHYTQTAKLTSYFKTMMWYGQVGFELMNKDNTVNLENTHLAATMSYMILHQKDADRLWNELYTATSTYAGVSDDITIQHFNTLIQNVYGKDATLKQLMSTEQDEKLSQAVLALPAPKIVPEIIFTPDTVEGKQFRVMGQRYTIDADVMQQVIKPVVRPAASGLDVMAALGSDRAAQLGEQYANPSGWEEYSQKLEKAKTTCSLLPQETWQSNLYNGWLWSIQSAMQPFEGDESMPYFMQNKAWTDKSLMTGLGSFAELKHDNVLYSKQSGSEKGGPDSNMPYVYVEPNVTFYTRMESLISQTKDKLKKSNCLYGRTESILDEMLHYAKVMKSCSQKELTNQTFTEDEFSDLMSFGGMVDGISYTLLNMNKEYDSTFMATETSALISDVSTIRDTNECVEIGTGIPYSIYVICPYKGKLFLAEGTVFSYYEFTSSERLTDEKWHDMLGIKKKVNKEYDFSYTEVDPKADTCKVYVPKWQSSYFSNEPNHVTYAEAAMIWDKAMNPGNGPAGVPLY